MDITEPELVTHEILLASCIRSLCFHLRPTVLGLAVVVQGRFAVGISARLDIGRRTRRSGRVQMVAEVGTLELGGSQGGGRRRSGIVD